LKRVSISKVVEKPISGEWGNEAELEIDGIPVIRNTNFSDDGRIDLHDVAFREIPDRKIEKKRLKPGDIIIEKSGGSKNQPVGRVVYFDIDDGKDYLFSNFTSAIRPKKDVEPKYVHYGLLHSYMRGGSELFQNKTTGIRNLQLKRYLDKVKIPLPTLSEQKAIVAKLDHAQRLIDIDNEMLTKYDELIQSVFLEMFGDPVTNPKGWERSLIKNLADDSKYSIKAGPFGSALKKEFYVEDGYKIYGQEQVIRDDFNYGDYYINEERFEKLKNCEIKKDDVLISLVGSYGYISVVPEGIERGIINPRLMKISFDKDKVLPFFFKSLFTNESFEKLVEDQTHGGTMGILNTTIVKKLNIPVPPISLQVLFLNKLKAIKSEMSEIEVSLKKSEELFSSLVQGAFG